MRRWDKTSHLTTSPLRPQDVLVLEAADRVGGRVRELQRLARWPVQAGPEFIHGKENSLLVQELAAAGAKFREVEWPDYLWLAAEGRLLRPAEAEAEKVACQLCLHPSEQCHDPAADGRRFPPPRRSCKRCTRSFATRWRPFDRLTSTWMPRRLCWAGETRSVAGRLKGRVLRVHGNGRVVLPAGA